MDKLLLYTQLHDWTILISWLALSCGLFTLGLAVGMFSDTQNVRLKTERVLSNIGFTMMLSGLGVFLIGAFMMLVVIGTAADRQAPAKWFQHIPTQEAQFFQKAMLKRKSAVSISGFAEMEDHYMQQIKKDSQPKHVVHSGLAAQQNALLSSTVAMHSTSQSHLHTDG